MQQKQIGLASGISRVSTLDYHRLSHEGVNCQRGGLYFAELLLY